MKINPEKPRLDSFLIAILFLVSGIALFDASILSGSQITCFMGLGLTFWGAIFLLITPQKQVEGSFLVTSTLPAYLTMDRMLKDLKPKNEAYYIPSYTRDVDLPEHLKGLKETVTFIPEEHSTGMVAIEDIAKGKFQIENPRGLLITPPGMSILDKIEQKNSLDLTKITGISMLDKLGQKRSSTELTKIPFSELAGTLQYLLSELNLTKEIKM